MSFEKFLEACVSFEDTLTEGVYDQNILKAVFLGGSGGSGKGFVSDTMLKGSGLKVLNTDDAYEYLLTKAGAIRDGLGPRINRKDLSKAFGRERAHTWSRLDDKSKEWRYDVKMNPDDISQKLRPVAKKMTSKKQDLYLSGRLGVIMDSTATKPEKVKKLKKMLEALGYDTYMIFVNTSLETSIQRNAMRRRTLPDELLKQDWKKAQAALPQYRAMFGKNYVELDNNKFFGGQGAEAWKKKLVPMLKKTAARMYNSPIKNPIGKKWVEDELAKKGSGKAKSRGRALKAKMRAPSQSQSFFKD